MSGLKLRLLAFLCVNMVAVAAVAQDTRVYVYDALGRLVGTSVTGGPTNGLQTSTTFDPADNRVNYTVTGAPLALFSVSDASVAEGGVGVATVTRTGSLVGPVTVNYSTVNGTATAPADFTAASGTLSFAPGQSSKTISVSTVDDSIYEGNESLTIALSGASEGASIADGSGVLTIVDNEVVPQLAISGASATEGAAAVLTVSRTGALGSAVTVNYATANGTATAPSDYVAASGVLSFAPGETSRTISISTVDDNYFEASESFAVNLSAPTGGAVLGTASATVSIADNDPAPSFSISGGSATEGGSIVMSVALSAVSAVPHSVTYATADGTAVAPGDYTAATGTLTFLPGEMSKTITVQTVNDTIYEATETFSVRLSGASGGATIGTPNGTGTISDNDSMPTFSVSSVSVTEGGVANVTVTKSGSTNLNATVSYATADGTAVQGTIYQGNYYAVSGSLTFLPGETSKVVPVTTRQDGSYDLGRAFSFALSAPTGATITAPAGTVTILNIDPAPTISVLTSSPGIWDEGKSLSFLIYMEGSSSIPITVNYATSGGTATSGVDFTPVSGTATVGANSVVTVQTIQDSDAEADETVVLALSSPGGGATIGTGQAIATIRNDDVPPSQGPIANSDSMGSYYRCDAFTVTPLANDSDPGGHYPLTLVSVATGTGYTRTIVGNTVYFNVLGGTGARNILYVMQNSIGQQATGTITFTGLGGPASLCG